MIDLVLEALAERVYRIRYQLEEAERECRRTLDTPEYDLARARWEGLRAWEFVALTDFFERSQWAMRLAAEERASCRRPA